MKKKIFLITLMFALLFGINGSLVLAQPDLTGSGVKSDLKGSGTPTAPVKLDNPLKADSIKLLLATIVEFAIVIGTIVAVLMFVWIGFKFIMARGNETEIKEAKSWFGYAVLGTAILISAQVILEVIKTTLVDSGLVKPGLF